MNGGQGWVVNPIPLYQLLAPAFFQFPAHCFGKALDWGVSIAFISIGIWALKNLSKHPNFLNLWRFGLILIINIIVYKVLLLVKGNVYQTWKFASYVILPMGFVYLATLTLWYHQILKAWGVQENYIIRINIISIILIFSLIFPRTLLSKYEKLDDKINEYHTFLQTHPVKEKTYVILSKNNTNAYVAMGVFNGYYFLINTKDMMFTAAKKTYVDNILRHKKYFILMS